MLWTYIGFLNLISPNSTPLFMVFVPTPKSLAEKSNEFMGKLF